MNTEITTALEKRSTDLINAERTAEGLPRLKVEAHLNASAQAHSDWMAETGRFSHTGEGGSSATDRMEETGFPLSGAWKTAENLAYTSIGGGLDDGEIDRMHEGLMSSAGHRANIMDPDLAYVGIGLSIGTVTIGGTSMDAVYLTQNFADTEGRVLVQEEVGDETVLQPYQDGEPVGDPEEAPPPEDDRDDADGGSGGDCFVATAAYGDRTHPDVAAIRRFRDDVLVCSPAGRAFIRAYWIVGPILARRVRHDQLSGQIARALIAPLVWRAGWWTSRRR